MALTTKAKVKVFLDNKSDTVDDSLIDAIILTQEAEILRYLDRNIESDSYTEYYDGDGTSELMLRQYPITAISALNDDPDYSFGSGTDISTDIILSGDLANYQPAKIGIIKLDGTVFTKGVNNIMVTYTAGYSSVPADIEQAANLLVGYELLEGKTSIETPEGFEVESYNDWRDRAFEILARYKRVR